MKSSFTANISLINRTIKTGNTLLNEIKAKYSLENSDINEIYSSIEKSNQFLEDMKNLQY